MNNPARILVADDEPTILAAAALNLEKVGYTVFTASNGVDALALVREHRPDLALLDVDMPLLDGISTCMRIKADPALASIFVVLISGKRLDSDSKTAGLEGGADGFIARPVPNQELLAHIRSMLRIRTLTIHLDESVPPIHVAPQQIEQILENLLRNAYEAISEEGTVKLRAFSEPDAQMVTIAIQDNGPGIPADEMERIFEPLVTTKTSGIGLGLSISRALASANGGRLTVESKAGQGATFRLLLPTGEGQ